MTTSSLLDSITWIEGFSRDVISVEKYIRPKTVHGLKKLLKSVIRVNGRY